MGLNLCKCFANDPVLLKLNSMNKKVKVTIAVAAFIVLTLAIFLLVKPSQQKRSQPHANSQAGKVLWKFDDLENGVMARSGDYQVLDEEIESKAPMKSFKNKERDVLFALIYKQFVAQSERPVKQIDYSFKKISRTPNAVLNQYGIKEKHATKINFSAFNENRGLAKVDGKIITKDDIDFNNFIWGSFQTEIFHYKLSEIDKQLQLKYVAGEAKKLNLTTADYLEKYVWSQLPTEISEADVDTYLKKYNIDNTERNRKAARQRLLEKRRQRGVDYVLKQYVMKLPIVVNLKQPQFQLKEKAEWTFTRGNAQGLSLSLFSDTHSPQSVKLLEGLFKLMKKYKKIHFEFRPVFYADDRMQLLAEQFHFCVFMLQKDKFWPFFEQSIGDFKSQTESKLYEKATGLRIDVEQLKKCVVSKKYQELIDYHLKYAKYIGIQAGPVLYVGGEVLQGAIGLDAIEKSIQRQLHHPSAGVW